MALHTMCCVIASPVSFPFYFHPHYDGNVGFNGLIFIIIIIMFALVLSCTRVLSYLL